MNVLITCLSYCNLTGSELYVYELATGLTKLGHQVLVSAINYDTNSEIVKHSSFSVVKMGNEPNFKPDIIHCNQVDTLKKVLSSNTKIPIVMTVHSEIIPEHEKPIKDDRIKRYICVRPSIEKYCHKLGIKNTTVIYNPIDFDRFKIEEKGKDITLFVGTFYNLRSQAVDDLIDTGKPIWFIGDGFVELGKELVPKLGNQCLFLPPVWNIEKYLKYCNQTAGINFGRTAIEGWIAGRPNINYTVDDKGNILKKEVLQPKDIEMFNSKKVVGDIIRVYEEQIGIRKDVSEV